MTAIAVISCFTNGSMAQDQGAGIKSPAFQKSEPKPFRILTNGQRITIESNKDISKVIVWSASGNRFIEQTNIASPSYNFTVPSKEKFIFLMLEIAGKRYTEKVGIQ